MANQAGATAQFKHLFTPLRVGSFTVRNRIVSTAHGTGMADGGLPSQRHLDYWASKAEGGIGLIITEGDPVHPSDAAWPGCIHLWKDEIIEPFRRIADAVHRHGGRIVGQMSHMGSYGLVGGAEQPTWSASQVPNAAMMQTPREMTVAEIEEVVQAFASAAHRLREAGLDGVEIHAAHGYLIEQFMSPLFNRREDGYGGDEESRLRFAWDVIEAVRSAVGVDATVGIRVSGDEFEAGGLTLADMQRIVPKLTGSGQLDYVNVTFKGPGGAVIAPMYVAPGQYVNLAAGIKQVTDLPIICIERITNPVLAEAILERHEADLVGMTRANICDPELPNKAREGRLDEIRYCVGLNEGCSGRLGAGLPISCSLNPSVGREETTQITMAPIKKRVMIIGGGIAGMEAARVAALRGHSVSLYEKEAQLGGQLQIAAKGPGRSDMTEPVRYYTRQFELLRVDVHLGMAVDEELVRQEAPEVVIVATGALPATLAIEGAGEQDEAAGVAVALARDVLAGTFEVAGDKVVLFATDQGMEGLTTAELLAERGKDVEVLIPRPTIASKAEGMTGMMLLQRLVTKEVKLSTMAMVKAVRDGGVVVANPMSGREWIVDGVGTLVISVGSRTNDDLWKAIQGTVKEVYGVGDCVSPRRIQDATLDGLRIGLQV